MNARGRHKNVVPRNSEGFTVVETIVAVFISSILFCFALFVYNSYARMTHTQESQASLQQQLMLVRGIMEKDVHMSGFNLPGNGVLPINYGLSDFKLVFLRNEYNKNTTLYSDANSGDSILFVNDAQGVSAKQWMCLANNSDTICYHQISYVGLDASSGCDTIKLNSIISASWDKSATKVHFAKGVYYDLPSSYGGAGKHLTRHSFEGDMPIGPLIDSIDYIPKDSSGVLTGNGYAQAQSIQITLGGCLKTSAANSRLVKTFDALIRN